MPRAHQTVFICRNCGSETPKWFGKCPACSDWGTLEEQRVASVPKSVSNVDVLAGTRANSEARKPQRLADLPVDTSESRLSTGISEFDRVLGGGLVPGSMSLIGGEPGIGKSTLLTQVSGKLSNRYGDTLYVSGEESAAQIKLRVNRLRLHAPNMLLHNETNVAEIAHTVSELQPKMLIVDSIQTMHHPDVDSYPGSVSQVRAATSALTSCAKAWNIPTVIVGHVTKEGAIAGPRVLEHMVDVVLTFEGDRHHAYRILRTVKNRFGSTDEIGLFQMAENGLEAVDDASLMLLSERRDSVSGSAVVPTVEGTRPLLVEIQSLVSKSYLANPRRTVSGLDTNRVNLILAVLEKRCGFVMGTMDVYVNAAGGVRIDEPATDLAIAVAAASSLKDVAVDGSTTVIGEIGLGGEVRAVPHIDRRLAEASRLGFDRAIIPARNKKSLHTIPHGMIIVTVSSVTEAIDKCLVFK